MQACKKDGTAAAKKIDCSCAAEKFSKKHAKKLKEYDAEIAKSKNPEQANIHKEYKAKFIKESSNPRSSHYQGVLAQSMKACMKKK